MGRNFAWTESTIRRLYKEGRGNGTGGHYRPWLQVQNISSDGRSTRLLSQKTGRVHHLLSDVEYHTFLHLEFAADVVDIREQFPLDRAITRQLASDMGIKHPVYPSSQVDTVMTCDFVATVLRNGNDVEVAINVKTDQELENSRSVEKLALQHAFFVSQGIDHFIVTDSSFDAHAVDNMQSMRAALPVDTEIDSPAFFEEHETQLLAELQAVDPAIALHVACRRYDEMCRLRPGSAMRIARILMFKRKLAPCLREKAIEYLPLSMFLEPSASAPTATLSDLRTLRAQPSVVKHAKVKQ